MNSLGANMKLIVDCAQKLQQLGERVFNEKKQETYEPIDEPTIATNFTKEHGIPCPDGYIFKDENGNIINVQKIVLEKKKKEYPKTYEECVMLLGLGVLNELKHCDLCYIYKKDLIVSYQKLLICRDAYWKIAGEEMGLDGPWEPDSFHQVFSIGRISGTLIGKALRHNGKTAVLEFPTAEMRDAFYENFKNLIEQCKELL